MWVLLGGDGNVQGSPGTVRRDRDTDVGRRRRLPPQLHLLRARLPVHTAARSQRRSGRVGVGAAVVGTELHGEAAGSGPPLQHQSLHAHRAREAAVQHQRQCRRQGQRPHGGCAVGAVDSRLGLLPVFVRVAGAPVGRPLERVVGGVRVDPAVGGGVDSEVAAGAAGRGRGVDSDVDAALHHARLDPGAAGRIGSEVRRLGRNVHHRQRGRSVVGSSHRQLPRHDLPLARPGHPCEDQRDVVQPTPAAGVPPLLGGNLAQDGGQVGGGLFRPAAVPLTHLPVHLGRTQVVLWAEAEQRRAPPGRRCAVVDFALEATPGVLTGRRVGGGVVNLQRGSEGAAAAGAERPAARRHPHHRPDRDEQRQRVRGLGRRHVQEGQRDRRARRQRNGSEAKRGRLARLELQLLGGGPARHDPSAGGLRAHIVPIHAVPCPRRAVHVRNVASRR